MPEDEKQIAETTEAIRVSDIQSDSPTSAPETATKGRGARSIGDRGEERQEAREASGPSATQVPAKRSQRTANRRKEAGADAAQDPALEDGLAAEDAATPPGRPPLKLRTRGRGLGTGGRASQPRGPRGPQLGR